MKSFPALDQRALQARDLYCHTLEEHPQAHFDVMRANADAMGFSNLPVLPQPYILSKATRQRLQHIARHFALALESICQDAIHDGPYSHLIQVHPRAQALLGLDADGPLPFMSCARFDGFLDEESGAFYLLECNAGDPSGDGYTDALLQMLMTLPAMQSMRQSHQVDGDRLLHAHHHWITQIQPEHSSLRWAKLSDPASFIHADHLAIIEAYQGFGKDMSLADPRHFAYDGQRLTHEGQSIDALLRDTIDELILPPHWPDTQPILDAYQQGHVQIYNPFKSIIGDAKGLLEPLSTPEGQSTFSPETREVLQQCMPWTRVLRECHTTHHNQPIDLLPFVRRHQATLVLKPCEGYGGFGVKIGAEVTNAEWEETIAQAIKHPTSYLAQTYIPAPTSPFVTRQPDGSYTRTPKNINLSFWVHNLQFSGCFARISDDSIINVHQGGALLPVAYI